MKMVQAMSMLKGAGAMQALEEIAFFVQVRILRSLTAS